MVCKSIHKLDKRWIIHDFLKGILNGDNNVYSFCVSYPGLSELDRLIDCEANLLIEIKRRWEFQSKVMKMLESLYKDKRSMLSRLKWDSFHLIQIYISKGIINLEDCMHAVPREVVEDFFKEHSIIF